MINCERVMDISKVEALHKEMEEIIANNGETTINAKDVETVDTASLQLVYAFNQVLKNQHGEMLWGDASDAMKRAAHLLGMDKELGLK